MSPANCLRVDVVMGRYANPLRSCQEHPVENGHLGFGASDSPHNHAFSSPVSPSGGEPGVRGLAAKPPIFTPPNAGSPTHSAEEPGFEVVGDLAADFVVAADDVDRGVQARGG